MTGPTPTLMGIPPELRDRIYKFVWCSPGCVRITQEYLQRQMLKTSERTYPEPVAFPYPPKDPPKEPAADSEDEDDWKDEPEDYFSASEEDEVETQKRAAELANRSPINDGKDSTDDEELPDSDDDGKIYHPFY
jgi:hypothetical protein